MGDWPLVVSGGKYEAVGSSSSTSKGTGLQASSSANVEPSSYTQIIASTAFDAVGFYLQVKPDLNGNVAQFLVDLAAGASSNERDIITDLFLHRAADTDGTSSGFYAYFPIPIPAGTRISGRVRSAQGSGVVWVIMSLVSGTGGAGVCGRVTCYGQDTSDSGGLLIDPGGTANTMVYTEFSASIANPIKLMYLSVGFRNNTSGSPQWFLIRAARGASGAEANNVMFADFMTAASAGSDEVLPQCIGPIPVNYNAGDRLAIGIQCSTTDSSDRLIDCQVIGLD